MKAQNLCYDPLQPDTAADHAKDVKSFKRETEFRKVKLGDSRQLSPQHNVRTRLPSGSILRRQNGRLEIKDNIIAFREVVIPLKLCFVSQSKCSFRHPFGLIASIGCSLLCRLTLSFQIRLRTGFGWHISHSLPRQPASASWAGSSLQYPHPTKQVRTCAFLDPNHPHLAGEL